MVMDINLAEDLTVRIERLIAEIAPDAVGRRMYGGTMFETEANNPKTGICGHFVYKNHMSLEFTDGVKLPDPKGILEGNGKYRRHIKLASLADIKDKEVESFLKAAFELGAP